MTQIIIPNWEGPTKVGVVVGGEGAIEDAGGVVALVAGGDIRAGDGDSILISRLER